MSIKFLTSLNKSKLINLNDLILTNNQFICQYKLNRINFIIRFTQKKKNDNYANQEKNRQRK